MSMPASGRSQDGKAVALVTGGGTGVGKAIAKALAADGYKVIITGRRMDVLQQAADDLAAETGGSLRAISADVGEPSSVAALFDVVSREFGRLDLLVNNAGMGLPGVAMEEISFEQWSAIVSVNLTGAFLCTQHAFRLMKVQSPRGGRIINNGSISATTPRPNSAPYTATKHAITGLTKSTALDGRDFDIACGQIDIGNATTEMTQRMSAGVPQANGTTAVEPTIDAAHVANAVLYMASLPLDANVLTMTVMATKMPFVGRG
ncbi:SDR family oxidoreductase [Oryzifoliimicrobium ureilyticus]|uniref:SDR family oxidoreductase n=1 Tax=Oryzifoliimicrobium ureilyticus TaxID=3113724 RepID=UPI0030760013